MILRQINPDKYILLFIAAIIGGILQSLHGNLQHWGILSSYHRYFGMTGTFPNPGPFAGYLGSIFPIALGLYLLKKINKSTNEIKLDHLFQRVFNSKSINGIAGISIIAVLTVLPITLSRASWIAVCLSSLLIIINHYSVISKLKSLYRAKQIIILFISLIFVTLGVCGLLRFKTNSANGRILIWKVTTNIIKQHPITGVGFDKYKSYYMEAQADYFEKHLDSSEKFVADNNIYCFNDFLLQIAENGFIGFFLVLVILFLVFRVKNNKYRTLILIVKAGLVSIIVFSFFSYPSQILDIKILFISYIAFISSSSKQKIITFENRKKLCLMALILSIMLFAVITIAGLRNFIIYNKALKHWNYAYNLYETEQYPESLIHFQQAYKSFQSNSDFLMNYGKALYMAGKHNFSIEILQRALKFYPNIFIYQTLGDNYKKLNQSVKAEKSYLRAWYMIPNRFYPKYLLAILYDETEQSEKAVKIANELLSKEIKINSTAIEEIKQEMTKIIDKYSNNKKRNENILFKTD
ncbi:MAG: O-antigen ligase family protein [Bacteroidales bacterium]|jgi:tetratricopeptide (TPR) repeat protein|nr:O-antigen ligase family protein [Bacteroidales bacterium]